MQSCKHEEGYFCVNCWEKGGPEIWEIDIIQEFMIPPYATRRVSKADPWPLGALLPTKDGRRTGNGCIIEWGAESLATVLTDAGNTMVMSQPELAGNFHPPELVTDPESYKRVLRLAGEEVLAKLESLRCPLFVTYTTMADAQKYVEALARASDNPAGVLTAVHSYANTLIDTTLNSSRRTL